MDKARSDFIKGTMAQYSKLKYIGRLKTDSVAFPDEMPKPTGKEDAVEVHLFEFKDGTQFLSRWRFTDNNIKK